MFQVTNSVSTYGADLRNERRHRQWCGSVDISCLRSSTSLLRSEGANEENPKCDVQGCTSPHWGFPSDPLLRKGTRGRKTAAMAAAEATPPQPSPALCAKEGAGATTATTAVATGLVPQPQDQAEQHELSGVITAVDCPQFSAALGELVVDAEARRDHAETGNQAT